MAEGTAASVADYYGKEGFSNTKALKNGIAGWKEAGFAVL
jgi:rhodanese-related sulfurtransferase